MVASRAQARLAGNHSPPPRPTGPRTRSAAVRTGVVWGESGTGPPRWGKGGSGPSGGVKEWQGEIIKSQSWLFKIWVITKPFTFTLGLPPTLTLAQARAHLRVTPTLSSNP